MKVWDDIESLSDDVGISERTAWRWLRQGRIKKKKSEDGRIIFVLVDEPTDITDTDFTDNVTTDTEPISGISTRRVDRKLSIRPGPGLLVQSMRDELEASKLELELSKIEDAQAKWEERRDRERREKIEAEGIQRSRELQTSEQRRREEEKAARVRSIKQRVKNEIFSSDWVGFLSSRHRSKLIIEMERALSQVDVEGLPEDELLVIVRGVAEQIREETHRERDRINKERQEQANKETQEVAETILEAVKLGAGMS